ncbi:hypothetical protein Tco_0926223 [Tanacetum coccineum]|uniref:Uncharacterized protein n=1 Tax=Tanacetum coccineum TaxID=301880 RepID=A0ABQ5DFH0_9ASTR
MRWLSPKQTILVVVFYHRIKPPSWCGGDGGVGCGGTAAGEEGEGKTRVRASEYDERVDRVTRINFGVRRKSPPEKFSGGGATVVAGSGGGGGWPDTLGERERVINVSGKTEKLPGISFHIKLL